MSEREQYVKDVVALESRDMDLIIPRLSDPRTVRLLHAAFGLSTEAGEFLDMLKRHIFYGREIDDVNAVEEIGDIFWYSAVAIDVLKTTFEEVKSKNIAKLRARYPEKFTEEAAENRDLKNEREVLEGKEEYRTEKTPPPPPPPPPPKSNPGEKIARNVYINAGTSPERWKFENWVSSAPYFGNIERIPEPPSKSCPGQYRSIKTQIAWEAWNEARSHS